MQCWTLSPQFSFAYVRGYLRKPHDVTDNFVTSDNDNLSVRLASITDKQWKLQGGLSAHYLDYTEIFFTFETDLDDAHSNYQEYKLGLEKGYSADYRKTLLANEKFSSLYKEINYYPRGVF